MPSKKRDFVRMENPLLNQGPLPSFSSIIPEQHIEAALKQVIAQNRAELAELLSKNKIYTWDNLVMPMENMGDRLSKVWAPVSHMHSVAESESLRKVYNACLPLLTEYHTEIMQNEALFNATQSISDSPDFERMNAGQKKIIQNDLRDFKLAGVNLSPENKARYAELQKQLSKLQTQFAENLLDATHGWSLEVTDPEAIVGLPEQDLRIAEQTAAAQGKPGWVFTLEYPCYAAVMKYLENRQLRRLMYEAYSTRASDQGPNAGRWDNTTVIEDILRVRYELANLLGFANYAEYSLAIKMADSTNRVLSFLWDLVERSYQPAQQEIKELQEFAKARDNLKKLETWDVAFYSEKLRQQKYSISQEELRVYFPVQKVLAGLFTVVNKLYGITIVEKNNVDTWHPQVGFYEVYDENNELRGCFYTDLFARPHKRDGAWMDECRMRRRLPDGSMQTPVAFLTCNFLRPVDNKPALLTQDDVETLFHEFGHCLHHLLTKIEYASISGINGVPWDAVEFPSQIMEHWAWERDTMPLISGHFETGEAIPDSLYNKLLASKNFQSGLQMLRQLEFSLFDFRIHMEYDPALGARTQKILEEVRAKCAVISYPTFNRFQNSFSHIFAGSYAAGYYSYKWAEVLSSDAYSLFEETGVFNHETGKKYLQNILEVGGIRDPMISFVAFRGREPKIDALLRHSGLAPEQK
jgi:oligopeptidase A